MSNVSVVVPENWDQVVVDSLVPVLVDFWAPWCHPCREMIPIVEEAAEVLVGRVKVVKFETTGQEAHYGRFHVEGIPCLMLFKRGIPYGKLSGCKALAPVLDMVEDALAEDKPLFIPLPPKKPGILGGLWKAIWNA